MALADLDRDRLAQQSQLVVAGLALGGDDRARVEARAVGVVGEHDQSRGVIAPYAARRFAISPL